MNEACDDDSSKQFCRIRQPRHTKKTENTKNEGNWIFAKKMLSRNKRAPQTEDGRVELENKISFDAIFLEFKKGKSGVFSDAYGEREIVAVDSGGNHSRVNEAWIYNEISKHPTKTSMLIWRVVRFTTWNNFPDFFVSLIAHFSFFRKKWKAKLFLLLLI